MIPVTVASKLQFNSLAFVCAGIVVRIFEKVRLPPSLSPSSLCINRRTNTRCPWMIYSCCQNFSEKLPILLFYLPKWDIGWPEELKNLHSGQFKCLHFVSSNLHLNWNIFTIFSHRKYSLLLKFPSVKHVSVITIIITNLRLVWVYVVKLAIKLLPKSSTLRFSILRLFFFFNQTDNRSKISTKYN